MSDLIDRQAALDAIRPLQTYKLFEGDDMILVDKAEVQTELMMLPSAELGTNLAEVGTDCISRQAAIDEIDEWIKAFRESGHKQSTADARLIQDGIIKLSSAQPEIIRCKDCKHWIPYDWMFSEVWQSKNIADYPEDEIGCNLCDMAMKANDFCSRVERRTE